VNYNSGEQTIPESEPEHEEADEPGVDNTN